MRSKTPEPTTISNEAVVTLATEVTRAVDTEGTRAVDTEGTRAVTLDMVETKVVTLDTRLIDDGKACIAEMTRESNVIL